MSRFDLYWIYAADGALLYIGITERGLQRLVEHLKTKRWADEICDHIRDKRTFLTRKELEDAEEAAIREHRPRFNIDHNEGNPDRVDPHTMCYPDGRLYRPDLYHQASNVLTATMGTRPTRTPVAEVRRREVPGWLWTKPTGYAALWLVLAGVLWVTTGRGGWDGAAAGVGGASASFVIPWARDVWAKLTRRRRRKRRR